MEILPSNEVSEINQPKLDLVALILAPKVPGEHEKIRIQVAISMLSGAGIQYVGVCVYMCVCESNFLYLM